MLGYRGFVEGIYQALYEKLKCKSELEAIPMGWDEQKDWLGWNHVLRALMTNKTLETVGNLLLLGEGPTLRRNPQVHAVLTSNVDNLWRSTVSQGVAANESSRGSIVPASANIPMKRPSTICTVFLTQGGTIFSSRIRKRICHMGYRRSRITCYQN